MTVTLVNAQRVVSVNVSAMARLARSAMRRLGIRGRMVITFVSDQRMRSLNRRFLKHDWPTDVLSFRYDQASGHRLQAASLRPQVSRSRLQPAACSLQLVVGEILIAPSQARAYARAHGISYEEELARYVVHGLLHWMGHDDRTAAQQKRMRSLEDQVLAECCR